MATISLISGPQGGLWINTAQAASTIPKILNYQARITDPSGTPVPNGSLNVTIQLYSSPSGATCVYAQRGSCGAATAKSVTVTNGSFTTLIGDTASGDNAIPDNLFDTSPLYLGIAIAADAEMTPRKELSAAAYAFNADRLDQMDTSNAGGTSSYVVAANGNGNLVITGDPQGSGISNGSLYINPAAASAGETLFGVADNGAPRFRISKEGDTTLNGSLLATAASSTAQFIFKGAASQAGNVLEARNSANALSFGVSATSTQIWGDLSVIKGVNYSWPSVQGGASTVLQNDGSGNLSWAPAGTSSSTLDLQQAYSNSTSTTELAINNTQGALSLADALSGVGNIFEIQNLTNTATGSYSARYFTVSSTSTLVNPANASGYKVGIGTSAPAANGALHVAIGASLVAAPVAGTVETLESAGDAFLSFMAPTVNSKGLEFSNNVGNIDGAVIYDGNLPRSLQFRSGGNVNRMVIGPTGLIGVNNSAPANQFTVGSTSTLEVDANGNLVKIFNVPYSWPNIQGGASTVLTNNGAGALSWVSASTLNTLQQTYNNATSSTELTINNGVQGALTIANTLGGGSDIFEIQNLINPATGAYSARYFTVSSTSTLVNPSAVSGYKLGVGTANPATPVDANAGLQASAASLQGTTSNNAYTVDYVRGAGGFVPGMAWYSTDNFPTAPKAGFWMNDTISGSNIQFGTSNSFSSGITNTAMTIDPSGNIGIGDTTPLAALTVGNGDLFRVTTAGKTGIGGIAPATNLDVNTAVQAAVASIQGTVANNPIAVDYARGGSGGFAGGLVWYATDDNPTKPKGGIWLDDTNTGSVMQFGTSNTYSNGVTNTALSISQAGFVGVGNAAPANAFTVGSTSTFEVNVNGNLVKVNNVPYSWPSTQGGASAVLTNNGSGTLTWTPAGGGVTLNQTYNNSTSTTELWTNGTQGALSIADTVGGSGANLLEIQNRLPNDAYSTRYFTVSSTSTAIGTASPLARLHVANGTTGISFTPNARDAAIIEGSNANGTVISLVAPAGSNATGLFFGRPNTEALGQITWSDLTGNITTNTGGGAFSTVFTSNGQFGIGNAAPANKLTVGSTTSTFEVDASGNLVKVNGVPYSWPNTQGGSSTVLTNNGSGVLSWAPPSVVSTSLNQAYLASTGSAEISLSPSIGALTVADNVGAPAGSGDIFEVQDRSGTSTTGDYTQRFFTVSSTSTNLAYNADTTQTAHALTVNGLTSGTGFALSSSSAAMTGTLASIVLSGSAGANTGTLLNLNSSGISSLGKALQVTMASNGNLGNGAGTGGGVNFNFTGNHSGNAIQIDDSTNANAATSLTVNANGISTSSGSGLVVNVNGITTGTGSGLLVSSTSAYTATGNSGLLEVNSNNAATTGTALMVLTNTTAATNAASGLVHFNFNGNRTSAQGAGFWIDDNSTTLANTMRISESNMTTGTAELITMPSITSGLGLSVSSAGAGLTGTGALINAQYTGTGAGNLVTINGTNASNTSTMLSVNDASTGSVAGGKVNFTLDGTGVGFQIDETTASGNAMTLNANSVTSGSGLIVNANTLAAGNALLVSDTGNYTGANGIFAVTANAATSGTITKLSGTGLTTGTLLSLTGGQLAGGNLLSATGTIAGGGSATGNGLVVINANFKDTGATTNLKNSGLLISMNNVSTGASGQVIGSDVEMNENSFGASGVHGHFGYVANVQPNSNAPADNIVDALYQANNDDTVSGNQIVVTDAYQITSNAGGNPFTNGFDIIPTNGTITNGFVINNGSGAGIVTNGINFSGGNNITTDFVMQNGATIDNNVSGTINTSATTFQVTPNTATGNAMTIAGTNLTSGTGLFINGGQMSGGRLISATGTMIGPTFLGFESDGLITLNNNVTSPGTFTNASFGGGMLMNMNDVSTGTCGAYGCGGSAYGYGLDITENSFSLHDKYGYRARLLQNNGSPTDNRFTALFYGDNADTAAGNQLVVDNAFEANVPTSGAAGAITNGFLATVNSGVNSMTNGFAVTPASGAITNGFVIGSTGTVTNGINFGAAAAVLTNDFVMQNGETIQNDTDGTIAFTDGTNTLCSIIDLGVTGSLSCTGGITSSTSLNQAYLNSTGTAEISLSPSIGALTIADNVNGPASGDIFEVQDRSGSSTTGDYTQRFLTVSSTSTNIAYNTLTGLANATGMVNVSANAMTGGRLLNVTSTSVGQTGRLLEVDSAATGNTAAGSVRFQFNGNHTGTGFEVDDVSTAGTTMNIADDVASFTGTVFNLSAAQLSSGVGVNITAGGTSNLTTGSALRVTGPTGTASVNTNGIVQFTASGDYSSVSGGSLLNVTANGTTAGTIETVSGAALTSGIGLNLASTGSTLTTGSLLRATTGAPALDTNGLVQITSTGAFTTVNGAALFNVTANSATTNVTVAKMTANNLTGGTLLDVSGGSLDNNGVLISASSTSGLAAGGTNQGIFRMQANMPRSGSSGNNMSAFKLNLNDIARAGVSGPGMIIGYDTEITDDSYAAHPQYGFNGNIVANNGTPVDLSYESMFRANNSDDATGNQITLLNGFLADNTTGVTGMTNGFAVAPSSGTITNGFAIGSTGTVVNGINFSGAATAVTNDFVMQNGETIQNNVDGTIAFTDGTNTLCSILDLGTTGSISCTGGSLTNLQQAYNGATSTTELTLNGTQGALTIANPLASNLGNLFEIQDQTNAATGDYSKRYLTVSSTSTTMYQTNASGTLEVNGDIYSKGTTWTARTAASTNAWESVTYGNGLFVAVSSNGSGNQVMTSPDGINWTSRVNAANSQWKSVTYGQGLFVAVSSSGLVMTSPDGITWTSRTAAAANSWQSVTYGNGTFVAVASSGASRVMTSSDGVTWTSRSAAAVTTWDSVAYGNGTFVAVANDNTSASTVMTSPDGVTWTIRSAVATNQWKSVTYGNGLFVAVASSAATNRVMTSPNGQVWTGYLGQNASWQSVTYGNGLFVAVTNGGFTGIREMTSPDGANWTSRTSASDNAWVGVTYGNGTFVAVDDDGLTANAVMTSGKNDVAPVSPNNIFQGGVSVYNRLGVGNSYATPAALSVSDAVGGTGNIFEVQNRLANDAYSTRYFTVSSTSTTVNGNLNITGTCTGCGSASSLNQAYLASTGSPEIAITPSVGALTIADAIGGTGNIFEIQDRTAGNAYTKNYFTVSATATSVNNNLLSFADASAGQNEILFNGAVPAIITSGGTNFIALDNADSSIQFNNSSSSAFGDNGLNTTAGGDFVSLSSGQARTASSSLLSLSDTGTPGASTNALKIASNTVAGTGLAMTLNSLTTGKGISVTSTGSALTTGSLLNVSSGTTGAVATNGIVSLNATGNFTSTSNVGLLNLLANATTRGTLFSLSGTSFTSGVMMSATATSLLDGEMFRLNGGTAMTSGTMIDVATATYATPSGVQSNLVNLNVAQTSTTAGSSSVLTALNVSTAFDLFNAAAGSKSIAAINVNPPTVTQCRVASGKSCQWFGMGIGGLNGGITHTSDDTYRWVGITDGLETSASFTQSGLAGSLSFMGLNITKPSITQTTGVVTSTGIEIDSGAAVSGTNYGIISDASSGNWGVGTLTPATALEVVGTVTVSGDVLPKVSPTSGAASQTATVVDNSVAQVGWNSFVKIGSDGLPFIAYDDHTNADLRVTHCGNSACSSGNTATTVDTNGDNNQNGVGVAIGTDGFPVISYYDSTNGDLRVAKCNNVACTSSTNTAVDTTNNVGQNSSIAIGFDGLPIISEFDVSNGDLRVVHCGNASCTSGNTLSSVDLTGQVGQFSSIAIGGDHMPVISYSDATNGDLKFAYCQNISCTAITAITVDATPTVVDYTSMAIGPDELPVIVYKDDAAGTKDVKVAKCNDTRCVTSTVGSRVTTDDVGSFLAVAIAADGLPVLTYQDATTFDLMVLKCGNASCSAGNIQTDLESANAVGFFTSIAVAPDGLPIVTHYDSTNGTLRSIKCADAGCKQTSGGAITGGSNLGSIGSYFNDVYANSFWGKEFQISGFDLAETYHAVDASIEAGDIVRASASASDTQPTVEKTAKPYDAVMGVISTKPAINLTDWQKEAGDRPVALAGRVPVKVSAENGPIKAGDQITSSSVAGVGMKSTKPGMVLGTALQPWDGPGAGVITVFVQPKWYAGSVIGTDGTVTTLNDDVNVPPPAYADALQVKIASHELSFSGSAWDSASSTAVSRKISVDNDILDKDHYQLAFRNDTGNLLASLDQSGNLSLAGSITTNGGFDYAEQFPAAPDLDAGDIVMADPSNSTGYGVKKTQGTYEASAIGVISTKPGFLTGKSEADTQPVALAGRVPVKVSGENGAIKAGDPITSSSAAGVGMKATQAGRVVGIALQGFDGSKATDKGTVVMFVNPSWWNGPTPVGDTGAAGGLSVSQDSILDFKNSTLSNVGSIVSSGGLWSVTADGILTAQHIETKSLQTEQVTVVQSEEQSAASEGKIVAGYSAVTVQNAAMKSNSKVFVSFLGDPGSSWWVGEKGDGNFTLHVKVPVTDDTPFEYWIVGVDDRRPPPSQDSGATASASGTQPAPTASASSTPAVPTPAPAPAPTQSTSGTPETPTDSGSSTPASPADGT